MEFTVTSFNVHNNGLRADFVGPYDLRSVCAALEGEIRVFQEVGGDPSVTAHLSLPHGMVVEDLELFPSLAAAAARNDEALSMTGHLVVASSFPVRERRVLTVPAAGRDPRDKVLALRLDVGGKELWLVAVHLTTGLLPYGSFRQLRALRRVLPPGPMVVVGDHNLWYPPSQMLLGPHFQAAVRGKTWPAHRPRHQIDHIWVRGLGVVGGMVLPATASDHLAVTARLQYPAFQ